MNLVSILPDWRIRELAQEGMIDPFEDRLIRTAENQHVISYGLSSFGYDLRCADEWKVFTNAHGNTIVDPKAFDERAFIDLTAPEIIIPPNSFVLARSYEYLKIPDTVMVVALGKSTYARCGIVANVTPLEPGWEGHVTLEFSNTTPLPAKMYAFEGCVQLLFFEGEKPEVTYGARQGKYQGQTGVTLPRL
nr:dCTP deaminase [Deinococcus cavernae]